jgi:hypothetical protein
VSLAFTAAQGFKGLIPKGTRGQSMPANGGTSQFFETSEDLPARDTWNLLAPRVTRPQLITPPATYVSDEQRVLPVVTGADVVDTVYFSGITTNLKPGDALLFVFSADVDQQYLRRVETVNPQGDDKRTEVTLVPLLPVDSASSATTLLPYIDKAIYLFPESELAQQVADILGTLITNVGNASDDDDAANLLRGVIAQVRERRDIAVGRGFTRVSAWADHLLRTLELLVRFAIEGSLGDVGEGDGEGGGEGVRPLAFIPSSLAPSPLAKLTAIVDQLALPASLQPLNSKRLVRSAAQSFSPQSDAAPRLLAALKPRAATKLYSAWTKVETPTPRVEIHVARAKAALFAHNFAGNTSVTGGVTHFTPPSISSAWGISVTATPAFVALDAPYDQVKPGSWVVIDRPEIAAAGVPGVPGNLTYHRVTSLRTTTMDAGTDSGYATKSTQLTLDPPWLQDLTDASRRTFLGSTLALRRTVVYAQSEALPLVDEPLDTDVHGNAIELSNVYDGLEAGRWIIVSGDRTDITDVSGVQASELVMVSGVAQGARPPLSVDYPLAGTPFAKVFYTTNANAFGDRLVVGRLADPTLFKSLPLPTVVNQQYRDQVQLAPGVYANAYVPTQQERAGSFPDFAGLLVDPSTGIPFFGGVLPGGGPGDDGLFAWRISSQPLHTVLTLANALAYKYDTRTIKIYGNVVHATHGQTIGEVLGDGDSAQAFQKFVLRQAPLTYVSAPTAAGADSTLSVRVNEIEWHEVQTVAGLQPRDRKFVTDTNDTDVVSVVFGNGEHGARLPTGKGNIKATYRYGIGKDGNVDSWLINQLATHPLGVQGVVNPLPASGGADRDTRDEARRNAPLAVTALDRLVSIQDYEDFARNYAGIGKASALRLTDGRRQFVHLTVAGKDDIPLDRSSDLYRNLLTSLQRFGDPQLPIAVCIRRTRLLVISAGVRLLPDYSWESVEPVIRAAVLDLFSFDRRELGQTAFLSEVVAVIQNVAGVSFLKVDYFDSVAEAVTAAQLATLAATLTPNEFVPAELAHMSTAFTSVMSGDVCQRVTAAELVYLTAAVPETLTLRLMQSNH